MGNKEDIGFAIICRNKKIPKTLIKIFVKSFNLNKKLFGRYPKKIKKANSCKAQHEIVGFVLIIIIVAIVGLVFLSFSIGRGERVEKTSVELSDFLQSSLYYTTECLDGNNYNDLQGLIKSCYKEEDCSEDETACDVLEKSFSEIISNSFQVSESSERKAYELSIYYKDLDVEEDEEILFIEKGVFENCGSSAGASQLINMGSGNINVELDFCYG